MIEFDAIPQEHLAHVLGLVTTAKRCPPADFDRENPSRDDLEAYMLPLWPESNRFDELDTLGKEILSDPFEYRIPEFPGLPEHRHRRAMIRRAGPPGHRSRSLRAFARGHLQDSRNWSGAYLTPHHPQRFTLVAGKWRVPDPQIPPVASSDSVLTGGDYRSSTWIGFGGKRPYNPLPQIGTSQHVKQGVGGADPEFGAWWQWWLWNDESHHYPIPILNFEVEAGNVIIALLLVTAPDEAQFFLKNQSTGVYVAFRVSVPNELYPLGATAEWVHERPTEPRSRQMYPLPRCTPVQFQNCLAASGGQAGEIERLYRLGSARFVRMFEVFDNPHHSAFVSVANRDDPSTLSVKYRNPASGELFA